MEQPPYARTSVRRSERCANGSRRQAEIFSACKLKALRQPTTGTAICSEQQESSPLFLMEVYGKANFLKNAVRLLRNIWPIVYERAGVHRAVDAGSGSLCCAS